MDVHDDAAEVVDRVSGAYPSTVEKASVGASSSASGARLDERRVETMGIPAGSDRNELDCDLCDDLDHAGILQQCHRAALWKRGRGSGWPYFSACAPWFLSDTLFLVHPVLDVSAEDLSSDLRLYSLADVGHPPD